VAEATGSEAAPAAGTEKEEGTAAETVKEGETVPT
jgi:hypothetical protein|tara:strand:+ start:574 stop:678 length:105 start_codon:yes stop_codon:yes gene_type:complete